MQDHFHAALVRYIPDAALLVDREGIIIEANRRAEELFRYDDGELAGLPVDLLVPEAKRSWHAERVRGYMMRPVSRPEGTMTVFTGQRRDGGLFPADITLGPIVEGHELVVLATIRDVSERQRAAITLRQTNRALRLLSASNRTLLRSNDEQDLLAHVCRIAVEIGGYRLAWVGYAEHDERRRVRPVAHFGFEDGFLAVAEMSWGEGERGRSAMSTAIRTGRTTLRQHVLADPRLAPWHDDACRRNYQSAVALPLRVGEETLGALAIYAPEPDAFHSEEVALLAELADDLSFGIQTTRLRVAHDHAQDRLHRLAFYDPLTGLPNRALFMEHFNRFLAVAASSRQQLALLLLDLEHLREINESYGHPVGDQVLATVARRLRELFPGEETLARFEGNDFVMICPAADQTTATALAGQVLAAVSVPVPAGEAHFTIGGSVGISLYPGDGSTPQELLSQADLAMYRAKADSGGYRFYRAEMSQHLSRKMELAHRLERALAEGGLELYYQPKVDLASGALAGAEALLRWNDPLLGPVPPAEFIPVAEERGMMVELGEWVLNAACRQVRAWRQAGFPVSGRIAVNVSSRQLDDPNFVPLLARAVTAAGISPADLELELTESAIMSDPARVIDILGELKRQGFSLAIDDFGTGYSSLVYLKRFPVDTLKIDQLFVRNMLADQSDYAIVTTIIAMARHLGLTLVAEGVEDDGHLAALRQLGCDYAQGYYFSRPEPAPRFAENWLARHPSR
ncbi:hypothetical protein GURASL_28630 [Geotalea uraniireducens]|uniref:EAL domain-containing protein n=1 Tax=Geotalea uraniireducens TaxID=351604 RepID=A0ABM8EMW9_9BACT|nr:EAL domain-containing protein [Geotalea uraniireducens]BDV43940.1 hypothetical protein GURASL_28630 [Geotalea uraniireducens]